MVSALVVHDQEDRFCKECAELYTILSSNSAQRFPQTIQHFRLQQKTKPKT